MSRFKNFTNFKGILRDVSFNRATFGLVNDTTYHVEKLEELERTTISKLNPDKDIIKVDFPETRFFKSQTDKTQIVLHHTVSGRGVDGDINWWKQDERRIATSKIIDYKGDIHQCFPSEYWAHHIGVTQAFLKNRGFSDYRTRNVELNKQSIGIEIDAWGGLVKHTDGKWYPGDWDTRLKRNVPRLNLRAISEDRVYEYPRGYRGFYAFEKYTPEQIESLRKLLLYYSHKHDIVLTYNDMFEVSDEALAGKPGVWSHTSFRRDKSDIHPQSDMVLMLKSF